MVNSFSAHGQFTIEVNDNVIRIVATGPWNIEFFNELHIGLYEAGKKLIDKKYGILLIPVGEAVAVNESIDYHVQFIRQGNAQAVAINLAKCDFKDITKHQCTKAYQMADINHAFFDQENEALTWLNQQITA